MDVRTLWPYGVVLAAILLAEASPDADGQEPHQPISKRQASNSGNTPLPGSAPIPLKVKFEGREGIARTLACSPDGKTLAMAGSDGMIRLWDIPTRKVRAKMSADTGCSDSLMFTPDSATLISVSQGCAAPGLRIWDSRTGKRKQFIQFQQRRNIEISPDGTLMACWEGKEVSVAGYKLTTYGIVWRDVQSGKEIARMDEFGKLSDRVNMLFSPDGKRMAVSDDNGRVSLLDVAARRVVCTLRAHLYSVWTWSFSPSGEVLATGGYAEPVIKLWSVADGKLLKTLKGHTDEVGSLDFSPDGRHLVSSGKDRRVRLWDVARGAELASFTAYERREPNEMLARGPSVMFLPDGRTVAAFDYDQPVTLWDVAEALRRKLQEASPSRPAANVMPNAAVPRRELILPYWVSCRRTNAVAFSPDGKMLACAQGWPGITVVDLWNEVGGLAIHGVNLRDESGLGGIRQSTTTTELWTLEEHGKEVVAVAFSPDGALLASGSRDKTIRLWDMKIGKALRTLTGHQGGVDCIAFSTDGRTLTSSCSVGDPAVRSWNVETGEGRRLLELPKDSHVLTFSADGRMMALGGPAGTIRVCQSQTGELFGRWDTPTAKLKAMAFSPDGKTLATGGTDAAKNEHVLLWDIATRTLKRQWDEPVPQVVDKDTPKWQRDQPGLHGLSFFPDGAMLAVAYGEKCVRLREASSGRLLRSFRPGSFNFTCMAVSADGKNLAVGEDVNSVNVFDVRLLMDLDLHRAVDVLHTIHANVTQQDDLVVVDLSARPVTGLDFDLLKTLQRLFKLNLSRTENITDEDLARLPVLKNLVGLEFSDTQRITNAGLAHLAGMKRLRELNLRDLPDVSDPGMVHLDGLVNLELLNLDRTGVSSAGLASLRSMTALRSLSLSRCRIDDASLANVAELRNLESLDLSDTPLSSAALVHLKSLNRLKRLDLDQCHGPWQDEHLKYLAGLKELRDLNLSRIGLHGKGLRHLAGLPRLAELDLSGTNIGDEGFAHVKNLQSVESLWLPNKITDAGCAPLANLSRLRVIHVGAADVGDGAFRHLAGLTTLEDLNLGENPRLAGFGLAHLKNCPNLTSLDLGHTHVTDAGLAGVGQLTHLKELHLPPHITDAGLPHLGSLKNLRRLDLRDANVTDAGLLQLQGLENLRQLTLVNTKITDGGVRHLKGLDNLEVVAVQGTAISEAGRRALNVILPNCYVAY